MNFFESQDRVRKNTAQLVFLFILAVGSLIVITNLLVMIVFGCINSEQMRDGGTLLQQMDWPTFLAIGAGVGIIVLFGSLYKIMALSAGGRVVAESLGGQLIPRNTQDLNQRKLLNVVEEMAIASGTPAPPVYILADEAGINAFAAGFSPRDAVIGVTQGTIDHLNRDQLQGVIAHEFSHIFNGDMRLNIRLIGILNGILIIGIIGYYILRSTSYSRRSRDNDKGAGGILALGIGLMVIGFAGTFFGGLIKAAVSRQREYLADASAVQFTRNPDGIAGALKRIGGLANGSIVENPHATEVSHAFFAKGVTGFIQSLSATHPPLRKRILRIDPHWDGKFDTSDRADLPRDEKKTDKMRAREAMARQVGAIAAGAAVVDVANAIDRIGNPGLETIDHARALISGLPVGVTESIHDPYGARAVIYTLVIDQGKAIRARQLQYLQQHADPDVYSLTVKLMLDMNGLDIKFRIPIIDLAVPVLKQLSFEQYQSFRENLVALIEMDARIDLLEWSLQKILLSHLDGHFSRPAPTKVRYTRFTQLKVEIELILSVMAYAGHPDNKNIKEAFHAAAETLEIGGLEMRARNEINLPDIERALEKLRELKPLAKPQLLKAFAASVMHDQKILPVEVELLRAISEVLDCPMPPIVL